MPQTVSLTVNAVVLEYRAEKLLRGVEANQTRMTNRLMLLFFLVAMATRALAEEADEAREPTEKKVKEVVFSLEKEMAKEVMDAVNTINEIFPNPSCVEKEKDNETDLHQDLKRIALSVEKRTPHWIKLLKQTFGGKRSTDEENQDLKRRALFVAKRTPHWIKLLKETFGGKRSTDEEIQVIDDLKRRALSVEKRTPHWIKLLKQTFGGKRSADEQTQDLKRRALSVEKRTPHWIKLLKQTFGGKRSTDEEIQAEAVEFHADVEKLRDALEVLNEVLDLATMSEMANSKG